MDSNEIIEFVPKDTTRAARRIEAKKHQGIRKFDICNEDHYKAWRTDPKVRGSKLGNTVAGVNPWTMPGDGMPNNLLLHKASTRAWERRVYHRADRRLAKNTIVSDMVQMIVDDYLDCLEFLDYAEELMFNGEPFFCSDQYPFLHATA